MCVCNVSTRVCLCVCVCARENIRSRIYAFVRTVTRALTCVHVPPTTAVEHQNTGRGGGLVNKRSLGCAAARYVNNERCWIKLLAGASGRSGG